MKSCDFSSSTPCKRKYIESLSGQIMHGSENKVVARLRTVFLGPIKLQFEVLKEAKLL